MNVSDAIQQFCKQNLKFLTSTNFDRDEYKKRYREFFYTQYANRFGKPNAKEICEALVLLLKRNGILAAEIVQLISTLPFFADASEKTREELIASLNVKDYSSSLSVDQIETIKKVGAYKALELTKGEEIAAQKQAALEALDRQIESKRVEYESLPSVLDEEQVDEPDFDPEEEHVKPWWERFYLKSDPFPRKDGLSSISEEMYEVITTKTKPSTDTLSALNRNSAHLFNTGFLLAGGYGYGKTTFVDYVSYHLIHKNILPIRITCTRCSSDASGFADSFFHRLRKELHEEARKITHVDQAELAGLEIEDQVIELVKYITSRRKGVVIFMDDYHKYASHFPQIFEFLGTLQVLKDSLTRKGLPAGFVVSGLESWKLELSRNSQLSGFLDNVPIEMPDVNGDLVCEVFNKRIKAFCYEGTPRLIKSDFVAQLVKEFAGKAGLRDYITKIVDELSHNNYAIVDSPIEIRQETLDEIKNLLAGDAVVSSGLTKLVYGSMFKRYNQQQIAKALELLVHIGMQGGITETDREFAANRFYFQTLRDCCLIQKQRLVSGNRLSWMLHSRLSAATTIIYQKFGLRINDYLLKLYAYKGYAVEREEKAGDPELEVLKRFFGQPELKLDAAVSENIGLGLRALEAIGSRNLTRKGVDELGRAYAALEAFSMAIFSLDTAATFYRQVGTDSLSSKWESHPRNDQVLTEAFTRYADYNGEKTPHRLALALKQVSEAAFLAAHLLRELLEQQALGHQFCLLHRPVSHVEEEIDILTAVHENRFSTRGDDHFDYVRRVTDWLELRLRNFFYVAGVLTFGENYIEKCPKAVVTYAYKNLETRVTIGGVENRFDGLTRSQFRQILCENNPYKECIVDFLKLGWLHTDWVLFGETFAEFNIETAHLQLSAFDVTRRNRYLRYCAMAEELTAAINEMVARVIPTSVFLCRCGETAMKPDEIMYRVCLRPGLRIKDSPADGIFAQWSKPLDSALLADHVLTNDAFIRVKNRVFDKLANSAGSLVFVDLLNLNYTVEHYRANIREIVCSLAYMAKVERIVDLVPWMGSSVALRLPGSTLRLGT